MKCARYLAVVVLAASLVGQAGASEDLKKTLRIVTPLPEDIRHLGIHVEFKDSPKLSLIIGQMLKERGYRVVATKEEADVAFKMQGTLDVKGGGKTGFSASMAELAESGASKDAGGPDYQHQNITGESIAVESIATRTIYLSHVLLWLSQKTGIAGRANELLTGDPRGICVTDCDNWKRLQHITRIAIISVPMGGKPEKRGFWSLHAYAYHDKVEAEKHVAESLVLALEPFDHAVKQGAGAAGTEKPL